MSIESVRAFVQKSEEIRCKRNERVRFRPSGEIMTVGELMEILAGLNPDAEIIIGRHENDCEDYIEEIIAGRNTILLATDPDGYYTDECEED